MGTTTADQFSSNSGGQERQDSDPGKCGGKIDRNAPAGSPNSLGAKSDCNGRPTTDDSVVEAKDEMGPLETPRRNQDSPR